MGYDWKGHEFIRLDSLGRVSAYAFMAALGFSLAFAVIPYQGFAFHFFQLAVFASAFAFGPFAGAAAGAISSSYSGLFVVHNPYIILGNAILGFGAGYFAKRLGAFRAAMAGFAIQLPYLVITDLYLVHMPFPVLQNVLIALLVTNIACALVAARISPALMPILAKR